MKTIIINLMLLLTATVCIQAQDRVFYYYGGEKIYLERDSRVKFIQFAKSAGEEDRKTLIDQLEALSIKVESLTPHRYKISGDFKAEQAGGLLLKSLKNDIILYFSDMLKTDGLTYNGNQTK